MYKQESITIEVTTCANCGVHFGVPEDYLRRRREDGISFYCPNGHSLSFEDTELKQLKRKLEDTARRATQYENWYHAEQDDHQHTQRRLSATKGVLTKTKRRIANGVCPCCSRHFVNLERHMKGQHPEYQHEDAD